MKIILGGISAFFLLLVGLHVLSAQPPTEAFPNSLLGFLEPGTHIGVRYGTNRQGDRDERFSVHILDDGGWQIANDAKSLPLSDLRIKYPIVESLAAARIADYKKSLQEREVKPPEGKQFAEPAISMNAERTLLGTVIHKGDDYVLISYGDDAVKRQVLPMHMINKIYWDDGLPNLSIRSR